MYFKDHIRSIYEVPIGSQYGVSFDLVVEFPKLIKELGELTRHQRQLPRRRTGEQNVQSTLHIKFGDRRLRVEGHGATGKEADEAATLHALCQLHKLGDLAQLLATANKYLDPGAAKLRREVDAKRDIIDYAARHDCLPVFSFHKMTRNSGKKPTYRAHTSIPQLGLDGYGRGSTVPQAVLAASISMKHAAEARHEATGDGILLVKDYTNLTTDSAEKFVRFYCNHQRIECNTIMDSTKENITGGLWILKVTLKSAAIRDDSKDLSILKPTWRPLFDSDAWPGVSRGEADIERTFEGIPMVARADAEAVGYLTAALALRKESAYLWEKFMKEMKRGNGDILKPLEPIDIGVGSDAIQIMENTLQKTRAVETQNDFNVDRSHDTRERKMRSRLLSKSEIEEKSKLLQRRLDHYETDPSLTELRRQRLELPMIQYRDRVMKMINENDVCIVVGATGSGKTTQVPQLILDELIRNGQGGSCNILCTQPRRIAAVSVAQRVAVERNEVLRQSVGYSVRFEPRPPEFGGSIHYCTTGVLLKQMQDSQAETLEGISHIIVDEVHERDLNNDFLLVVLKNLMQDRKAAGKPAIKVILMSATIDTSLFCRYFGDGYANKMCPHIEVPGRTFPVTSHFLDDIYSELKSTYPRDMAIDLYSRDSDNYIGRELEDPSFRKKIASHTADAGDDESNDNKSMINWKSKGIIDEEGELDVVVDREDTLTPVGLMGVTIAHLLKTTTEGSILVFLPGLQEIIALEKQLNNSQPLGIDFGNNPNYRIYVLHSSLPQMQQDVFAKVGPGERKVILATNIAETSITIPDVVYVVDSSKQREIQYDRSRRISSLVSAWTAKSNAQQRAGRAGRVQHGHYYTMASKARYESFEIAPKPEILRTDLQSLCLQIKSIGIEDIWGFLRKAIEPPSKSAVEAAIDELQALSALNEQEHLTPLGRYLSALPLGPSIAKMVVLAAIFRCLDPILILAALSTARNPFLSPLDRREEAENCRKKWAMGTGSDHAAIINAFQEWRRLRRSGRGSWQPERQFAYNNFLHHDTLCHIARTADQILDTLRSTGLVEAPLHPINGMANHYGSASENLYSDSHALQVALATAGFYPNIAVRSKKLLPRFVRTVHENEAQIFPYSLAAPRPESGKRYGKITSEDAAPPGTLFTFSEKTQADEQGIFLRSVARTFPLAVFFFGGKHSIRGSVFTVDEWIPFHVRKREQFLLQRLYSTLQEFLNRTFNRLGEPRQNRVDTREPFLAQDRLREPLVKGIVEALESCATTGSLASRLTKKKLQFYDNGKERDKTDLFQDFYSSSHSERSVDSGPTAAHPSGEADRELYKNSGRPRGFSVDGKWQEEVRGRARARMKENYGDKERGRKGRVERPKRVAPNTLLDLLNRWNK
jgi:HrpA-like RNA helicase